MPMKNRILGIVIDLAISVAPLVLLVATSYNTALPDMSGGSALGFATLSGLLLAIAWIPFYNVFWRTHGRVTVGTKFTRRR